MAAAPASSQHPGTKGAPASRAEGCKHIYCCVLWAGVGARGGGTNTRGGTWGAIHPSPLNLTHWSKRLFWQAGLDKHMWRLGAGKPQ